MEDATVIIAAPQTDGNGDPNTIGADIQEILEAALGTVVDDNVCITTTSTTTSTPPTTTTTTSTLIP
jgi:hypothetical protein